MRYYLLNSFFLLVITGCGYQQPAGKWVLLDASSIYFAAVALDDKAIDANYAIICKEARDEINARLTEKLPEKIAPLTLKTSKDSRRIKTTDASLKLRITRCEIDVDQSGGRFSYYLTLRLKLSLTQNKKNLLSYNMNNNEQISIDNPAPEFEFTFAEPVSRTLLLFNGRRLWLPAN